MSLGRNLVGLSHTHNSANDGLSLEKKLGDRASRPYVDGVARVHARQAAVPLRFRLPRRDQPCLIELGRSPKAPMFSDGRKVEHNGFAHHRANLLFSKLHATAAEVPSSAPYQRLMGTLTLRRAIIAVPTHPEPGTTV